MPELPEVETIKRGLSAHLTGAVVQGVVIRCAQLRWPIPSELSTCLPRQTIQGLSRRGKYLLIHLTYGTLIVHLGMSGSLRIVRDTEPVRRHDHVDVLLPEGRVLRYHDPRRFGALLWTEAEPLCHPLLKSIGIEPLNEAFNGEYLHQQLLNRRASIKACIMNNAIVCGIGNIYAAESLFLAGIHPAMPAGGLSMLQCVRLVESIKQVLDAAITQGGTTLKDFVNSDGKPGYFAQRLHVYGRAGLPCTVCGASLLLIQLGQRSTVLCEHCQPP